MEKTIMNFCGCDVVLRVANQYGHEAEYLERAEKAIKDILDEKFRRKSDKEIEQEVERSLGIKKK